MPKYLLKKKKMVRIQLTYNYKIIKKGKMTGSKRKATAI